MPRGEKVLITAKVKMGKKRILVITSLMRTYYRG